MSDNAARIQTAVGPIQSATTSPSAIVARGSQGLVELDFGNLTGGHVLHLAVAVCVFNDLHREAVRRGLRLDRLAVEAAAHFEAQPEPFHSRGITYGIDIAGDASESDLWRLASDVERIAEIPHALRQRVAVRLDAVRICR